MRSEKQVILEKLPLISYADVSELQCMKTVRLLSPYQPFLFIKVTFSSYQQLLKVIPVFRLDSFLIFFFYEHRPS